MPEALSTKRIFANQYLTLGIYFFFWCAKLKSDLNSALQRESVPSLWWFIVPGGGYYWVWRMAEALDTATAKCIKQENTFLWYLLLGSSPIAAYYFIDPNWINTESGIRTPILFIIFAIFVSVTMQATYIAITQNQLNKVRTAT